MLQVICMLAMLCDHIGYMADIETLRIIGRISMPIYAYFVVIGWHKTSNKRKYVLRLLSIATFAQLPYMALFGVVKMNICYGWALSCAALYIITKDMPRLSRLYKCIGITIAFAWLPIEYGVQLLLWVLLWYGTIYKGNAFTSVCLLIISITISTLQNDIMQIISTAAVPIVFVAHFSDNIYINKKHKIVWRLFYPAHLWALTAVKGVI